MQKEHFYKKVFFFSKPGGTKSENLLAMSRTSDILHTLSNTYPGLLGTHPANNYTDIVFQQHTVKLATQC